MPAFRFALACLLAATLGLMALPSASSAEGTSYVAVIDAGSSGTRLTLFARAADVTADRIYRAPTGTPGLSSFATRPAAAGPEAVQPLLDQLRSQLEAEGIAVADVPVALLATAGMRRLALDDPAAARAILASTRATIGDSGFPLRANRILPDTQEASLAWLDANAAAGTLDRPADDIGILEVGGASAQVAFRSPRTEGPGVSSLRVQGRDIHVVAISYLGLGANEARDLMQGQTGGGKECFPNNASGNDPVDYLAGSLTPVPSAEASFRGFTCGRAYAGVVRDRAGEYPRELRPRNLDALPGFTRADFVGLGAVAVTYADFRIDSDAPPRRALRQAMQTTCTGPDAWPAVRALFPTPTPSFAETQCSSAAYLGEFIFGPWGVGLDPSRFDPRPDFPGGQPSWPKGYAITVLHP